MFISMTFDVLGFFLTTLMATSHAARYGSQSGLGLTLIRYVILGLILGSIVEASGRYRCRFKRSVR